MRWMMVTAVACLWIRTFRHRGLNEDNHDRGSCLIPTAFVRSLFADKDKATPRSRSRTERICGLFVLMTCARLRLGLGQFKVVDRLLPWLCAVAVARLLRVCIATPSRTQNPCFNKG